MQDWFNIQTSVNRIYHVNREKKEKEKEEEEEKK